MSSIKTPGISHHQRNQQARIAQGVRSDQLTRPETRQLRQQQREIRNAKVEARSDGQVTNEEREQLRQMQAAASRDIFQLKHNRANKYV